MGLYQPYSERITPAVGRTLEYQVWRNIRYRCFRKSHRDYESYGGRGITVCERWRSSFANFMADMGPRPDGLQVDRIDNNKNYSCGKCGECLRRKWSANCRWATSTQNCRNRRSNKLVKYQDREVTIAELSEITGILFHTLYNRIVRLNWSTEKAVSTQVKKGGRPRLDEIGAYARQRIKRRQ